MKATKTALWKFVSELPSPEQFPFPEMGAIQSMWRGDRTAKTERVVVKAAKKWLPGKVFYSGQVPVAKMQFGTWYVGHAIALEMERHWNFREFREGVEFWLKTDAEMDSLGNRDANPYEKSSRDRARSWDCGYMLGHAFVYKQKEETA